MRCNRDGRCQYYAIGGNSCDDNNESALQTAFCLPGTSRNVTLLDFKKTRILRKRNQKIDGCKMSIYGQLSQLKPLRDEISKWTVVIKRTPEHIMCGHNR